MVIVADAGGTKTDWWLKMDSGEYFIQTDGINPSVMNPTQIGQILYSFYIKLRNETVELSDKSMGCEDARLFFYGAGCNSAETKDILTKAFQRNLPFAFNRMEFSSDLEGAAKALFGDDEGIACILGTGSASGYYDGKMLIEIIPSLGYILGDEGSGAFMGKELINRFFKKELSDDVIVRLKRFSDMSVATVIRKTYRDVGANSYLGSFVPFLKENEGLSEISTLIDFCLKLFFKKNVLKYYKELKTGCRNLNPEIKIGFVGGLATVFKHRLEELSQSYGFKFAGAVSKPIDHLAEYYRMKI